MVNRIRPEMQDFKMNVWFEYVPSEANPADFPTSGRNGASPPSVYLVMLAALQAGHLGIRKSRPVLARRIILLKSLRHVLVLSPA